MSFKGEGMLTESAMKVADDFSFNAAAEELGRQVDRMSAVLDRLTMKVSPILISNSSGDVESPSMKRGNSDIAQMVWMNAERIRIYANYLSELTDRIDI